MPTTAVTYPPVSNVTRRGARLTRAFAGATTLAATFVESVAASVPAAANVVAAAPPPIRSKSWMGSPTATPNTTAVQLVMATETNEKADMNTGRPNVWPRACARCDVAYRVKSEMLRLSVAQNPTVAVSMGANADQNPPSSAPPIANADGAESIAPSDPPAARNAHAKSARMSATSVGAANRSNARSDSTPRAMIIICATRNAR